MNLTSKTIIFVGLLLKIIDDYYDMDIFSDTIGYGAQVILVFISIYLFTKDKAFLLGIANKFKEYSIQDELFNDDLIEFLNEN